MAEFPIIGKSGQRQGKGGLFRENLRKVREFWWIIFPGGFCPVFAILFSGPLPH
jgi:hypothetical protein